MIRRIAAAVLAAGALVGTSAVAAQASPSVTPSAYVVELAGGVVSGLCSDSTTLHGAARTWQEGFCTGHGSTATVRHLGWCYRWTSHQAAVGAKTSASCDSEIRATSYVDWLGLSELSVGVAPYAVRAALAVTPQVWPVQSVRFHGHTYL